MFTYFELIEKTLAVSFFQKKSERNPSFFFFGEKESLSLLIFFAYLQRSAVNYFRSKLKS